MQNNKSNSTYLFVIHGLPVGGAEKFLISLLNYFVSIQCSCHLVILSNDDTLINEISSRVSITKLSFQYKIDIISILKLRKFILILNPILIVCINAYSFFITKLSLLFISSKKVCLSHHSTKPFSLFNYLNTVIYFLFTSPGDLIIYLCEAQKKYLQNTFLVRMNISRVIYNGIDFTYFKCRSKKIGIHASKTKYKNNLKILVVARIAPEKNLKDAILILYNLVSTYQLNVELQLVGSGQNHYITELLNLVNKFNLHQYIYFKGEQSDVRPFYQNADLFLLTSSSETFPISVIEAMSYGLPSVITRVGGADELIVNGFNGYKVDLGNIAEFTVKCFQSLTRKWDNAAIREYAYNNFNKDNMLKHYKDAFADYVNS